MRDCDARVECQCDSTRHHSQSRAGELHTAVNADAADMKALHYACKPSLSPFESRSARASAPWRGRQQGSSKPNLKLLFSPSRVVSALVSRLSPRRAGRVSVSRVARRRAAPHDPVPGTLCVPLAAVSSGRAYTRIAFIRTRSAYAPTPELLCEYRRDQPSPSAIAGAPRPPARRSGSRPSRPGWAGQ